MAVLHLAHWLIATAQVLFLLSYAAFPYPEVSNAVPFGSHFLWPTGGLLNLVRFHFWYLCGVGHLNSSRHASKNSLSGGHQPWFSTYLSLLCGFKGLDACTNICWMMPGRLGSSAPYFLLTSLFGSGLLFIRNFKGPMFLVRGAKINCGRIAAKDIQARRLPPRP